MSTTELTNKEVFETSTLEKDLTKPLLSKIDLFLCKTNLDKTQQIELINLFQETWEEGLVTDI